MPADPFLAAASLEGVPSAVATARDGIDAVLRDRGLRRTGPAVTAESLLRGAVASAVLEGSTCDLDAVRGGSADAVAAGAVRLSTELLGLLPVWSSSPLQALARMHTLAAGGLVRTARLGQPTSDAGAARLQDLASALSAPTQASALVVAALAHSEVIGANAFETMNGVLARAVERLVLVSRGVDPASVTVPEVGHLAAGKGYERAIAGYAGGTPTGVRIWLLHALGAQAAGAEVTAQLI